MYTNMINFEWNIKCPYCHKYFEDGCSINDIEIYAFKIKALCPNCNKKYKITINIDPGEYDA